MPTEDEKIKMDIHKKNKLLAKNERDEDRNNTDPTKVILTYDLENTFALLRAEISNFYYKRKFSVYNLTAHCSLNKITYCAIWTEAQSGRSGNDIASALFKILKSVEQDLPDIKKIVLWSDSCVAQNKNKVHTLMLTKFLQDTQRIEYIDHKYSTAGHSQLQEVDAVQSAIEKHLQGLTIYSHITLIRQLLNMRYEKVKLKVIQMQNGNFYNFAESAKVFDMARIPFTKVNFLRYNAENVNKIEYKKSLSIEEPVETIFLNKKPQSRLRNISVEQQIFTFSLTEKKKKDLKSMVKFMSGDGMKYYSTILDAASTENAPKKPNKKRIATTPKIMGKNKKNPKKCI